MKFWEALKHMQEDGWECRRKDLPTLTYKWECGAMQCFGGRYCPTYSDLNSEWERVEPPKQKRKVKLYRKRAVGKDWSGWSTSETLMLPDQFFTPETCEFQVRYVEVDDDCE